MMTANTQALNVGIFCLLIQKMCIFFNYKTSIVRNKPLYLKSITQQMFQAELDQISESMRRLQDEIESGKEESKIVNEQLQTFQQRLQENTEELTRKSLELEQSRENVSRLEIDLESRVDGLSNLSREVDSLRKCLRESETKLAESEKEILSTKDRERSQKELNQQMIAYQKDLQEQIR
jgi:chromosome segregation ATPase